METFAITVVGRDRPGIIADVTGAIAAHGGNLEDSSMSLLRGTFAWMLTVSFDGVGLDELDRSLEPIRGTDLIAAAYSISSELGPSGGPDISEWQLTVHGADRPGIVSALARVLAEHGGNITDLTTTLAADLYVVVADFTLPVGADVDGLAASLRQVADEVGVIAHLSPSSPDVL